MSRCGDGKIVYLIFPAAGDNGSRNINAVCIIRTIKEMCRNRTEPFSAIFKSDIGIVRIASAPLIGYGIGVRFIQDRKNGGYIADSNCLCGICISIVGYF